YSDLISASLDLRPRVFRKSRRNRGFQVDGGFEGPLSCTGRGVVFHAAAVGLAAGRGRANGVNYFIRKTHGRHTEESPQRSATSGMGRSFSLRLDVQSRSDSQVRKSAA